MIRMASIQKSIRMYDELYDILNVIVGSAVIAASALEDMWDTVNEELDTSPIENARDELEKMTVEWNEFEQAISELDVPKIVVPQIDILAMNQVVNVDVIVCDLPTLNPQEIRPDTVPNAPPISTKIGIDWMAGASESDKSESDNTESDKVKSHVPEVSVSSELDIMEGIKWLVDYATYGAQANYDQARAEAQLMTAMSNNPNIGYDLQYTGESSVATDTQALQNAVDAIVDKAYEIQGRGIYTDDAMIAGATELSSAFSDPTAIVMMMDTLADFATGVSGGGEVDSATMAQYAGALGEAREGSYEAMIEKGLTFTEAQKAVIEGTATQEQVIAAIGAEYLNASQDIQAAAAINAVIADSWDGIYESLSNTPEGKIIQLNHAFGEIARVIGGQLYPTVILFVDLIMNNQGTIQSVLSGIALGLQVIMGILSWLLEGALNFAQAVIDNWSWISPVIYGIAAALAVYGAYLAIVKGFEIVSAIASVALAVGKGLLAAAIKIGTGATWSAVTAQMGLNSAMYACPIVWIIMLIIALIALFYFVVEAINKIAKTSVSATGIICGAFMVVAAIVGNLFTTLINLVFDILTWIWNVIAMFANFFGNVFEDPVGAIARLFFDLVDCILELLETLASAIDTIFGSNLAGTVDRWRSSLDGWVSKTFGQGNEIMMELDASNLHLDRFGYEDAWNVGYSFGEGIDDSIANFDLSSLFGKDDTITNHEDDELLNGREIESGVNNIVENTGTMADSMDITEEDLRYLRDIAEQEAVNRYTLAEVKIEQTNHNNINSAMDLDGVVSGLTDAVNESIDSITEGVHE